MAEIKPEDALDIRNVALLREIIPIVDAELTKLDRALENRVFSAVLNGGLTPEVAQQAWFEKIAYRKIRTSLEQKARLGATKAEAVLGALEIKG